jgi:hypothetical protein
VPRGRPKKVPLVPEITVPALVANGQTVDVIVQDEVLEVEKAPEPEVQPEPVQPEPVQPEPAQPEPAQPSRAARFRIRDSIGNEYDADVRDLNGVKVAFWTVLGIPCSLTVTPVQGSVLGLREFKEV